MATEGSLFKLTVHSDAIGPSNVRYCPTDVTELSDSQLQFPGRTLLPAFLWSLSADFNAKGSRSQKKRRKNCCAQHLKMLPCLNFCLPTPALLLLFYIWRRVRSATGAVNIIEIQTVEPKELSFAIVPS